MHFEFRPLDSLPRLAWCAHLRRGREAVEVRHGPWVETAPEWFVEGAWAGPFGGGGVVEAVHLAGTAGRVEPGQVVFCSPHNLCDRLQSIRVGDDLYVSNSLVFLLRITDDEPDPGYPYYTADRLLQQQAGIRHPDKQLRTARGRRALLHDHCNLAIRPDLSMRRLEKSAIPAPVDYADYVGQLDRIVGAVRANAADPTRRHRRYRPVVMISRGYDSPALAVLMKGHGAREAVTVTDCIADDGTAIGQRLGYEVTGFERLGFQSLRDAPEAEFHATPPGADVVMAVCEEQLVGALLVTGRAYGPLHDAARRAPPDLSLGDVGAITGSMMSEFRLRVGFFQFTPYVLANRHPEALHRMSVAPEMKPWSVGGAYDRPILRRIVEEAGIPHEWFGQRKQASGFHFMRRPNDMSAAGAADFAAYLRTLPPISRRRRWMHRSFVLLRHLRIDGIRQRLCAALGLPPPRRLLVYPLTMVELEMGFAFHWGYARIRSRYDAALGS